MGSLSGTTFDTPISAVDAAIDTGALFEVHTEAISVAGHVPTIATGAYAGQPERLVHFRTLEDGTPKVLNIAHPQHPSSNYLQVLETAEALFPGATTSMDVIDDGERLTFVQELGEPVDLGDGDTVSPNLLWVASLNGTWATGCHGLASRWFCTNQMPLANVHIKARRSANHDRMLAERSAVLAQVLGRFEEFVSDVSTLRRIELDRTGFLSLLDKVLPAPADDAHGKTIATYERKLAAIRYYYESEAGEYGDTAWAAYNAVQSAEFHDFTEGRNKARNQAELVTNERQPLTDKMRELILA